MRIPDARGVAIALRSVRAALKKSLKGLNLAAAERMTKGDYENAQAFVSKAKELQQFDAELNALRQRWKELRGAGSSTKKDRKEATPLWRYYQPVLKGIVEAGGECRRAELESSVERQMGAEFLPGDREPVPSGVERWRIMIRRARRPMVAEGWLGNGTGLDWRITAAGRRAAEKPPKAPVERKI